MSRFETKLVPLQPDVVAPDGSDIRLLLALKGGSFAHFTLASGAVTIPVAHRTVEEIWYVTGGRGEMWRRDAEGEAVVPMMAGTCLTIPLGTAFQFRTTGAEPMTFVAVTMPPWPGADEAYAVAGFWSPRLGAPDAGPRA